MAPRLVIEYVSGSGEEERDPTPYSGKFWVYERAIRPAYYAIWDPHEVRLDVYELTGERYQPLRANESGRVRIPPMDIELGPWDGTFLGNPAVWLRAWDTTGTLIPTPEESEDASRQRADAEKRRADAEKDRADRLAAKLRELGIDPERV